MFMAGRKMNASEIREVVENKESFDYHIRLYCSKPIERMLLEKICDVMEKQNKNFKQAMISLFAETFVNKNIDKDGSNVEWFGVKI